MILSANLNPTMKNKLVLVLAIISVAFVIGKASDFSGPEKVGVPNVHQPRSDWNFLVWYQGAGREWLRVSGDAQASDLSAQWSPSAVIIETTHEPVVVKTQLGWQIQFK